MKTPAQKNNNGQYFQQNGRITSANPPPNPNIRSAQAFPELLTNKQIGRLVAVLKAEEYMDSKVTNLKKDVKQQQSKLKQQSLDKLKTSTNTIQQEMNKNITQLDVKYPGALAQLARSQNKQKKELLGMKQINQKISSTKEKIDTQYQQQLNSVYSQIDQITEQNRKTLHARKPIVPSTYMKLNDAQKAKIRQKYRGNITQAYQKQKGKIQKRMSHTFNLYPYVTSFKNVQNTTQLNSLVQQSQKIIAQKRGSLNLAQVSAPTCTMCTTCQIF